jgi:bifunctional oligoribonuclease and PAP phosphatase NrnA
MKTDPIASIVRRIGESRRIAITSHLRPDGDSVCTSLALAMMGEALGKEIDIVNRDPTPFPICHFPGARRIRIGQLDPAGYDVVILLECADVSRSGQEHLGDCTKINIDHHYSNFTYADINWINPLASAVGEMVFELGERLGVPMNPETAENLYCAIVSDTGSFQFSNTTARAFATCHKLVELGASPIRVSERLYANNPPEKIVLLGQVLSTLRMNARGNIASITMFRKHLSDLNLKEIDTEDITTLARSIKGVEMVLFFKEMDPGVFRVSLRSKGKANAAMVAEHFGGGGHVHASGFTAEGPYDRLIVEIPRTVENLLRDDPAGDRPS